MNLLRSPTPAPPAQKPPVRDERRAGDRRNRPYPCSSRSPATPRSASGGTSAIARPSSSSASRCSPVTLLLVAAAIGLGFLLVDVLLPFHAIGHADEAVNDWLASHRSSALDRRLVRRFLDRRHPLHPGARDPRRASGPRSCAAGGSSASSSARSSSRSRPTASRAWSCTGIAPSVPRLDHLPVNQSYPSGHVAASVVVYVGLALLISSRLREREAQGAAVDDRHRCCPSSSLLRACIAACTIRIDAGAGVLVGLGCGRDRPVRDARCRRGGARPLRRGARMTRVAVIAHRGKSVGGGLPELRRVLAERGVTDVFWREVGKSKLRARAGGEGARSQGRADLRVGRRRDGAALRRRLAGTEARAGDHPGRHRQPARDEPRHPEGHRGGGRHRPRRATPIRIDVGRLNGERFAVMAGAGLDARMIGDADGGLKDRVGRLAYVWTGAKHLREKPFRAKILSTAHAGTTARRAASCSATSASCSAASRRSRTRSPTTACSSSASSLPTASANGPGRSLAPSSARRASLRTSRPRRRIPCAITFDRKVPYELDGGDRKKVQASCASTSSRTP